MNLYTYLRNPKTDSLPWMWRYRRSRFYARMIAAFYCVLLLIGYALLWVFAQHAATILTVTVVALVGGVCLVYSIAYMIDEWN